ncbi:uncharacterized protein LOC129742084 [Uranotaenia lowii]|uniref:uncharacterized protein LOC129742084 n=1 Tax=Uranotaenia lowii TaxID=190385 RepID=UPI002479AE6A|nr:uncharacterized protein LOC129742084 [Uranotaenia lowii]
MPASASTTKRATGVGSSLKVLNTKLKQIQTGVSHIWRFVEDFKEDSVTTAIEVRLEELESLWERYNDTIIEIQSHDDYKAEEDFSERDGAEFNDRYYFAKTFLVERIKERQEPTDLNQTVRGNETMNQSTLDHVRLPQIKLQTFDGNIDEWLSFRDLYTSLIHWKTDLPEVEKFHYLKGCLQGEPKALIDPLKITRGNYQIAWDLLCKRYNNNKLLRKRQVQALFQLPTLTKESVTDLHNLLEGFERIVQTLDQIVQPGDYKDLLLVHILSSRLDPTTRRGWEESSATKDQDSVNDMTEFLQRRVRILESLPSKPIEPRTTQFTPFTRQKQYPRGSFTSVQTPVRLCVVCSSDHLLFQCPVFQKLSVSEREKMVRINMLCRNCFNKGHRASECRSKFSCRHCKGRHHSLVCFNADKVGTVHTNSQHQGESSEPKEIHQSLANPVLNVAADDVQACNSAQHHSSQILLATAIVVIEDDFGNQYSARALLDSGSESNLLTERLSQKLRVSRERVDISVIGVGHAITKVKQRVQATVRSRDSGFTRSMQFLVLPRVTVNLPTTSINAVLWKIPEGIHLADPSFYVSGEVDIVLGIESFFDFFDSGKRIALGDHLPMLNHSVFGWVVCGGISKPIQSTQVLYNTHTSEESLENLMARFWSCEEIESAHSYSPEEAKCEELFTQKVHRGSDGRYSVSLPKNEDVLAHLGESKEIAMRRFLATERRLSRDEGLRLQYVAFMDEYLNLGHMKQIDESDLNLCQISEVKESVCDENVNPGLRSRFTAAKPSEFEPECSKRSVSKSDCVRNSVLSQKSVKRCFLPHHPVVKEASTTTKVRVVFDASCKTSSGVSLNDALYAGPVVQEDLRSIILRCRTKHIMVVADVEKMFRQIKIDSNDSPLQSILWRSSPSEVIRTYELCTITYGTKPVPFLATRTLQKLASDEGQKFPMASQAILQDTYVYG